MSSRNDFAHRPDPEAAVASRVRVLLERFPSVFGASDLIEAWLAVEPAGEAILNAVNRGAALDILNQVWGARAFQAAGDLAAAKKLAERVLRTRSGISGSYEKAASVLLKIDRAAAVSQLICWAKQGQEPAWFAGVIEALFDADPEVEWAALFCARELVVHSRVDGKELCDALGYLLCFENGLDAHSVAEAVQTRPELNFGQRRELTCLLAALGQLDLARSVWACLLEWQRNTINDDVGLIEDFLNAGVEQWAAERIRELIDDPTTAPLRVQRLRQMLAWLAAGCSLNP